MARAQWEAARAAQWGATVILKGARTVVADRSGPPAVIPTGNAGMASGGTGDVLAGLITGLMAQGFDGFAAACAAAWLHGDAAKRIPQRSIMAEDLLEALRFA